VRENRELIESNDVQDRLQLRTFCLPLVYLASTWRGYEGEQ